MVSPETMQIRRTGGLADAVSGLAGALVQQGLEVSIIAPSNAGNLERLFNETFKLGKTPEIGPTIYRQFSIGQQIFEASFLPVRVPLAAHDPSTINFYLVDSRQNHLFGNRTSVYGYKDDNERYFFFNRAVAEFLRTNKNFTPKIVHGHDWCTGYLGYNFSNDKTEPIKTPFFYSVHNLGYSTPFEFGHFKTFTGDDNPLTFSHRGLEFHGKIDPHKAAFVSARNIITVGPTYAQEIKQGKTPPPGNLYAGVLQHYAHKLHGILNGLSDDYTIGRFVSNGALPGLYSAADLAGKMAARKKLQEIGNLKLDKQSFILAMVSRWADQKGIMETIKALETLMTDNPHLQFVAAGEEDQRNPFYIHYLTSLMWRFPGRVAIFKFFEQAAPNLSGDNLEALIDAGSNLFLMPSKYEPCGLSQMKALKFGTPVLANRTGGLVDTIEQEKTGFFIKNVSEENIVRAVMTANKIFLQQPERWGEMVRQSMRRDFSWSAASKHYLELYRSV